MRKRKFKRTAGQRRYQGLRRNVDSVTEHLQDLQRDMQAADSNGKYLRQMSVMQKITEAVERLKATDEQKG